jgi:hypothetical protein
MNQDDVDKAPPRSWLELANGGGVLMRDGTQPTEPPAANRAGRRPRAMLTTSLGRSADGPRGELSS